MLLPEALKGMRRQRDR